MYKVTLHSLLSDRERIYASIQKQLEHMPSFFNLLTDEARWYECGEVYQSRDEMVVCHKYAGHPGRHAKRRRAHG